jgi:integrase
MPRQKLDDRTVRKLSRAAKGKSYYVMDSGLPNFGVRVYDNRIMWIVRLRGKTEELDPADGPHAVGIGNIRKRAEKRILELKQRITLGVKERFMEHARRFLAPEDFERILGSVEEELLAELGNSNLLDRHRVAQATMADLYGRLSQEILEESGRTPSVRNKLNRWRRYILPTYGKTLVREFSAEHVESLKKGLKNLPAAANAVLDHLREGFNRAARWNPPWRVGANPAAHVAKYPQYPRERVYTENERARLWAAIEVARKRRMLAEGPLGVCELTLATGCRPGEPLKVHRAWVEIAPDQETGVIRMPIQKGDRPGRKRGRILALGPRSVQAVLRQEEIPGNPYLFPGTKPGQALSYQTVQRAWRMVYKLAGVAGAVPYSARHTAGTEAEDAGLPLTAAKDLLGHTRIDTTDRNYRKPKEGKLASHARSLEHRLYEESAPTEEILEEVVQRAQMPHPLRRPQKIRYRQSGELNSIVSCACGCGETFPRFSPGGRERRFASGHGNRGHLGQSLPAEPEDLSP